VIKLVFLWGENRGILGGFGRGFWREKILFFA
jgi:hypothetical protein